MCPNTKYVTKHDSFEDITIFAKYHKQRYKEY